MAWSVVAKRNLHGSPSRFILRFARRCFSGEESVTIRNPTIGCSRVGVTVEGDHIGARRSYADTFSPSPTASESSKRSVGISSATAGHELSPVVKTALIGEKGRKKGTKTCPFAPSLVSAKSNQLFWNEWRGRRDSNSRPLP